MASWVRWREGYEDIQKNGLSRSNVSVMEV